MVGRSRALDHLRHRKVLEEVSLSEAQTVADDTASIEAQILTDERKRQLHAAIAQLPEELRIAVHLVYFEEMTYEEAAKVMKKNRKQIDNLLYRAKKALHTILGKDGAQL